MQILKSVLENNGARKMQRIDNPYDKGIDMSYIDYGGNVSCRFGFGSDCGIEYAAEIEVQQNEDVWLLATNDCTTKKWEHICKKWRGLLGNNVHVASHPTTGCGGTTKYLYCTTKEVQVID